MFRVGDRVWYPVYGWGSVDFIKDPESCIYLICVKFDTGKYEEFTKDGELFENSLRCLFFEEIPIPESALTKPRKSAREMLEECEGITFDKNSREPKYFLYYGTNGDVRYDFNVSCRTIGIKYISQEDVERIVKECKENN